MKNQASNTDNTVVAIFDTHESAESAVKLLGDAKIPMGNLSVIGRGYHSEEKVVGFYNTGDRVKVWGKYGAFWGAMWGLLTSGLYMTVPVIGPVVVLGHFAVMVLAAVEGAVVTGGISALGASLFSIGIPKNSVVEYEEALKADGFMVMVQGTAEEAARARAILQDADASRVDTHIFCGKDHKEATSKLKAAS